MELLFGEVLRWVLPSLGPYTQKREPSKFLQTSRPVTFGVLKILSVVNLYILESVTHIFLEFSELATANKQLHN